MEWLLPLLLKYRYLVLLPLSIMEGPIVALVAGFLVYANIFDFWIAYAVLLVGDIIPDSLFYCIGHYGRHIPWLEQRLERSKFFRHLELVENLWERHGRKMMFFGKLAYGLGLPFLASAGAVKVPFRRFISYAVPVTLFQYAVIMFIGYAMGNSFALADSYVHFTYLLMAVFVVVFGVGYFAVARLARRKLDEMEREDEKGI